MKWKANERFTNEKPVSNIDHMSTIDYLRVDSMKKLDNKEEKKEVDQRMENCDTISVASFLWIIGKIKPSIYSKILHVS